MDVDGDGGDVFFNPHKYHDLDLLDIQIQQLFFWYDWFFFWDTFFNIQSPI